MRYGKMQALYDDRQQLAAAFRELRKNGWWARMNYMCCQSCATAMTDDDKPYIGFHNQDNDGIEWYGYTYLFHGPPEGTGMREEAQALSNEAVTVLKSHGLSVEWDGDMGSRIKVLLGHQD
jgi:hypothetical protein